MVHMMTVKHGKVVMCNHDSLKRMSPWKQYIYIYIWYMRAVAVTMSFVYRNICSIICLNLAVLSYWIWTQQSIGFFLWIIYILYYYSSAFIGLTKLLNLRCVLSLS